MDRQFRQLRLSQLDRSLSEARNLPPRPLGGWIASVREALGLTLAEVGKHLRAPRQTVQKFEHAEATDRITLGSLRRIADAMGCDLVYALVPKSGSFTELAERPTRERVARDVKSVGHTMALENQKPENASQLTEDEVQRRLSGKSKRQS
ncbi:MAG: helix-turn-helix domain-containing protein [Candidatus Acidiferrum sp.]